MRFLYRTPLPALEEEEKTSCQSGKSNDPNDDTSSNASNVWSTLGWDRGGGNDSGGGLSCTRCCDNNGASMCDNGRLGRFCCGRGGSLC